MYFWLEGGSVPIAGKHASLVRSLQGICDFDGSAQRAGSGACFFAPIVTHEGACKQGKKLVMILLKPHERTRSSNP
jgi:hypothetical protein